MRESTIRRKVEEIVELYNEQKEILRSIKPALKKTLLLGQQMQQILDDLDEFVESQEEDDEEGFVEYESIFSDAFAEVDIYPYNEENIVDALFDDPLKPTSTSSIRRVLDYAKYGA